MPVAEASALPAAPRPSRPGRGPAGRSGSSHQARARSRRAERHRRHPAGNAQQQPQVAAVEHGEPGTAELFLEAQQLPVEVHRSVQVGDEIADRGGLAADGSRFRSIRRSRAAANSGRGSTGTSGRRRASSGSGITVALLPVDAPQRGLRPNQQRLGGMHTAAQALGHLRDGQPIQVAQRQRSPLRPEQGGPGPRERPRRPGGPPTGRPPPQSARDAAKPRCSPGRATPVVGQLVPGHPHQPATVTSGIWIRPCLTAATAAMNVSAVRSSATTVLPHRGSR